MFIGHLSSGYILGRLLQKHTRNAYPKYGCMIMGAAILGAIAPDFDLLYFYLVDNRQTHHHLYWSHFPVIWTAAFCVAFGLHKILGRSYWTLAGLIFLGGGFLHLLLDSVVGDVCWLVPFSYAPFSLFAVPGGYSPWWLNFILHWSFLLEMLITGWAFWIWRLGAHKV